MGARSAINLIVMAEGGIVSRGSNGGGANRLAVGYILIAVTSFSLIPLAVDLSGGVSTPFFFNTLFRLGSLLGCLIFLLTWYPKILSSRENVRVIRRYLFRWPENRPFLVAALGTADFFLFALSGRFLNIAVIAILFEIYPVVIIFLASWLFRGEGLYRRVSLSAKLLVVLSIFGFIFALAGQRDDFLDVFTLASFGNSVVGVILVLGAILGTGLSVFGWKWGWDLSRELSTDAEPNSSALCGMVIALFFTSLVSLVASGGIGLVAGESADWRLVAFAIPGGAIALALGPIVYRKANLLTDNVSINAVGYVVPILSLIWLYWIAGAAVARWDYLVMGTTAIVTANLLINFEAEIRWGFKALLLALGTFGAIVFLRDGVFNYLGIESWNWVSSGYFESITLSATVFTLLLAFRIARLVSRTTEEDVRTFSVYRDLALLAQRGVIDERACHHMVEIDRCKNDPPKRKAAYMGVRGFLAGPLVPHRELNEAEILLLRDAETSLDALARSKQVEIHLGEMFALTVFAAVTIALALGSVPEQVNGWIRLLVDVVAIVVSAVVVFLLVHMHDLQAERDEPRLEMSEGIPGNLSWNARFYDISRRSFDQWISIVLGIAIVFAYTALLAQQWVGCTKWFFCFG